MLPSNIFSTFYILQQGIHWLLLHQVFCKQLIFMGVTSLAIAPSLAIIPEMISSFFKLIFLLHGHWHNGICLTVNNM
jgi:hypothetical protein